MKAPVIEVTPKKQKHVPIAERIRPFPYALPIQVPAEMLRHLAAANDPTTPDALCTPSVA
jgi:hypothetical protein